MFLLSTCARREQGAIFSSLHLFRISAVIFWQSYIVSLILVFKIFI